MHCALYFVPKVTFATFLSSKHQIRHGSSVRHPLLFMSNFTLFLRILVFVQYDTCTVFQYEVLVIHQDVSGKH